LKIVMTSASLGMGVVPFPSGSPRASYHWRRLDVMKFLIMMHSLILCLTGYEWYGHVASRSLSKWSLGGRVWCLKLRSVSGAFLIAIVVASYNGNALGAPLLVPFLTLLVVAKMKAAPTSSTPETCRVAMSSSSLVVFSGSRLSSCTKVRHIMPSQNTNMTLASLLVLIKHQFHAATCRVNV
jgi:hypothetical protein